MWPPYLNIILNLKDAQISLTITTETNPGGLAKTKGLLISLTITKTANLGGLAKTKGSTKLAD